MPDSTEIRDLLNNCCLDRIRNRNEERVLHAMSLALPKYPNYCPDEIDIQDIYAHALNHLPARYAQHGSIVLHREVTDEMIEEAVRMAIRAVFRNPKHESSSLCKDQ